MSCSSVKSKTVSIRISVTFNIYLNHYYVVKEFTIDIKPTNTSLLQVWTFITYEKELIHTFEEDPTDL